MDEVKLETDKNEVRDAVDGSLTGAKVLISHENILKIPRFFIFNQSLRKNLIQK